MSDLTSTLCAVLAWAAMLPSAFAAEAPVMSAGPSVSASASAPAATPAVSLPPMSSASSTQAGKSSPAPRPSTSAAAQDRKKLAADRLRQKEAADREALREAEVRRLTSQFDKEMAAQQFEQATQLLEQLREQGSDKRLSVMRRVAWLYQAQGDLANARTWLERVIARLPNDLNAQLNLALIDAQEGRRVQALERMRALKFHHPDSPALDHVLSQLERG